VVSAGKFTVNGGCHCHNIAVTIQLSRPPEFYHPRACDCDFCTRHGAAYLSDAEGALTIRIHDEREVGRYVQGDQQAEFVLCRSCGVLIGAVYQSNDRLYAAVNANIFGHETGWAERQAASPKQLSASEKIRRWQGLWFPEVIVTGYGA
jgi:hypothetical protein